MTSVRQPHHWREGNLPINSKCAVCRKTCWSSECLAGMRCEWCGITVRIDQNTFILGMCRRQEKKSQSIYVDSIQTHSMCRSRVPEECSFGTLRDIIIPPYAISIPRIADLNKDLILGIGNNLSKTIQNLPNNSSNSYPPTESVNSHHSYAVDSKSTELNGKSRNIFFWFLEIELISNLKIQIEITLFF